MPELKINRFLGLYTRSARGTRPVGALDDVKNFVPNTKNGKLVMRTGTATDISGNITDISTANVITTFDKFKYLSTEVPETKDVLVLCGRTAGGSKKIIQKPFWQGSATATNSAVLWAETKTTSITSPPGTNTLVLDVGVSTVDDYYNGWIIFDSTRSEYLLVSDYVGSTKTVTTVENIPSDWGDTDTVILYRYFHDNPTFTNDLTYTNTGSSYPDPSNPPVFYNQRGSILFSGGQGSLNGLRGVWSGYINRTWFAGATKTMSYQGTYVTEAEIKSLDSSRAAAGYSFGDATEAAGSAPGLDKSVRWFIAFAFRTEDGEISQLLLPSTNYILPSAVDKKLTSLVTIKSNINKRFRYLDVFMGKADTATATTLDWNQYFLISSYDLTSTGWTYNESTNIPGTWTRTISLDINDWNAVGDNNTETPDAVSYLGVSEYSSQGLSFSRLASMAGRIFVANYYDYGTGTTYTDQIRYSPFSGDGVAQLNVLANVPGLTESTIEQGDSQTIQQILGYKGNLLIWKNNGFFYIPITSNPENWSLQRISDRIGCDVPDGVVVTPDGVCFPKAGEDVYMWTGGNVISLMTNYLANYRAFATTYKNQWIGWYNAAEKSYNLMITTDGSTKTTYYNWFFEFKVPTDLSGDIPALFKQVNAANISAVSVGFDDTVRFVASTNAIYKFSVSATDDNGTAIVPYFKTGEYVPSEKDLVEAQEWYLTGEQDGSGTWANNLDLKLYIDNVSVGSYTNVTKTKTYFRAPVPIPNIGTTIGFEYNTNGTPATFKASSATATPLIQHEIGIVFDVLERIGDLEKQV